MTTPVESCDIATLKPYPGNARTHSKKQLRQIADRSILQGAAGPDHQQPRRFPWADRPEGDQLLGKLKVKVVDAHGRALSGMPAVCASPQPAVSATRFNSRSAT